MATKLKIISSIFLTNFVIVKEEAKLNFAAVFSYFDETVIIEFSAATSLLVRRA